MQASMHMMADALHDIIGEKHLGSLAKRRAIGAVFPLPDQGPMEPDMLYVCDFAHNGFAPEAFREDSFYLVVGPVPPQLRDSDCQYVQVRAGVSANSALCAAIAAFRTFGEWHARLINELLHGRDMDRLCEIGSELIGHPILIYDCTYAVIGNSMNEEGDPMTAILEKRSSYYVTLPEMLNTLMHSKAFQETFATHGAAVFDDSVLGEGPARTLYVNLGRGTTYEGRVIAPYYGEQIPEGDFQILELFADVVRLAMKQPALQSDDLDRVFRIYLTSLLEGRATVGRQLDDSLRLWNWERTGSFLCLWARLSATAAAARTDAYLTLGIERALPGACAIRYKDGIACVAVLDNEMDAEAARRAFAEAAGEFCSALGASEPYEDVLSTNEYFTEARIAGETGSPGGDGDIPHFDEVALAHYHACGTSRLPAAHFCDQHVRALLPYRGTQRDYYNTLKVYLEHNMNLLHTSEALFVHRTTLFKHLKEIRAITGADLDDIPTRLRMLASFEIMALDGR